MIFNGQGTFGAAGPCPATFALHYSSIPFLKFFGSAEDFFTKKSFAS